MTPLQSGAAHLTAALEDEDEIIGQGPSIFLEQVADSSPTPTIPIEGQETMVVTDPTIAAAAKPKPGGLAAPVSGVPGSVAASRSVSPAPSLEAILLDRKRRLAAAGGQSSPPSAIVTASLPGPAVEIRPALPRVTTSGVKGTRFKSSPLGGFDRHGVVVAEKVKENIRSQNVSEEDVRIPDDKDKVGPDKKAEEGGEGS